MENDPEFILHYFRLNQKTLKIPSHEERASCLNFNSKPSHYHIVTMEKIDNLDRKILNIIMRNARIPSKDIAVDCGVSRAAIHQRIARLQEIGVIVGSGYRVDLHKLGLNT